jgi:hypothetical protein
MQGLVALLALGEGDEAVVETKPVGGTRQATR